MMSFIKKIVVRHCCCCCLSGMFEHHRPFKGASTHQFRQYFEYCRWCTPTPTVQVQVEQSVPVHQLLSIKVFDVPVVLWQLIFSDNQSDLW
jgi:hypothetical protein